MLRQFPAALKLYDRALDITPNGDVMAAKADIYQAQGNLPEAAKLLSEINPMTLTEQGFAVKLKLPANKRRRIEVVPEKTGGGKNERQLDDASS